MTVIPPTPWQEDVSCRVRPHGTCTQGQSDQGKARVKWEELSLCGDKRVDRLAPDGERVTLAWGAAWGLREVNPIGLRTGKRKAGLTKRE